MLDQDALNGDAGLAGISETSGDATVGGIFEIGVAMNDDGGIATEFEDNFLFSGAALDVPSHGHAAGKADELDAVVGDQQAGVFVGKRKDIEPAIGPTRLLYTFRQKQ